MKFRIVKNGKDGEFYPQLERWHGWTTAVVWDSGWGSCPASYKTEQEARDAIKRIHETPDEVVWEGTIPSPERNIR